jgi:flagellar biogenesis protein FliO
MKRWMAICLFLCFHFCFASEEGGGTHLSYATERVTPSREIKEVNFGREMSKMLLMLFGILVLLFVTVYLLKRFSNQRLAKLNRGSDIQIIEKRAISPKTTLFIIKAKNKEFLIAESHVKVREITQFKEAMSDQDFKHLVAVKKPKK